MKITEQQLKKIKEINEAVKGLDPILRERIIDYELYGLFKNDYLEIISILRNERAKLAKNLKPPDSIKSSTTEKKEKILLIRDFFRKKEPYSLTEKVTVLAFYLEHFKNMEEFGKDDISNAFFAAREKKPKNIGQALRDAKNKKNYLIDGSEKGKYRLSNTGESLIINDLPRRLNI